MSSFVSYHVTDLGLCEVLLLLLLLLLLLVFTGRQHIACYAEP